MRWRGVDRFCALNLLLFAAMSGSVYLDRFVAYFGRGRLLEFAFYAGVVAAGGGLLWWLFRRVPVPTPVLLLLEVGILMHFAGGLTQFDGVRGYDHYVAGIRYDKYVHFVNAFVVGLLIQSLFAARRLELGDLRGVVTLFMVLGLGGAIEVGEYVITRTVADNGVGGYDNNMQDLVANLVGGLALLAAWQWPPLRRLVSPSPTGTEAPVGRQAP